MKDIFMLGGPNGAGKTTAARVLLPSKLHADTYINADEIARRIDPNNPESAALAAGRIMLGRINELIAAGVSFAFETTCAGRVYLRLLENCKLNGWKVSLIYLWIPSPEYAIGRVARRVRLHTGRCNSKEVRGRALKHASLVSASGRRRHNLR